MMGNWRKTGRLMIDRLGFTEDDWDQEARWAEELSRRIFRRRFGLDRRAEENRYAAVSAYRARLMLLRAERRRPTLVEFYDREISQNPESWLEARDWLAALDAQDQPSLFRAAANHFNGRAPDWADKRRLRRCQT